MDSCEVIATLRDFSSSNNSSKWEVHNYPLNCFLSSQRFFDVKFLFYGDGNCEENEGYVSIICSQVFDESWIQSSFTVEDEIRYFFSIVDASGNKRFTQSIVYNPNRTTSRESRKSSIGNYTFSLERFLKRETLLNDPAELLPGDCLTISVEISCIKFSFIPAFTFALNLGYPRKDLEQDFVLNDFKMTSIVMFSFSKGKCGRLCIPLDSFYGRELCSLSGFFKRASETSLGRSTIRKVHIPDEEIVSFFNLCRILLLPIKNLIMNSIEDICQVYVIADKYDFQSGIEECRQIIKAFLCITCDLGSREHVTESVPDITKMADEYRDSDLKNTINTYQEIIESFGANDYALGKKLKEKIFSDWKFVSREIKNRFRFSRITKPEFESFV